MPPGSRHHANLDAFFAAREALRWVADAGVEVAGGIGWPGTRAPGARVADDLYSGTAGVLAALAEARLAGLADFDDHARGAARRLRTMLPEGADSDARAGPDQLVPEADVPDLGLYTGHSGIAAALHMWALASGDDKARANARALTGRIAVMSATAGPAARWRDLLSGQAGVLLVLAQLGDTSVRPVAAGIADQLVGQADWIDGLPDWRPHEDHPAYLPNFSHGLAGIGYALAAAAGPLSRPDLLEVAVLAARRLIQLGARPDGTMAVPHSIPLADRAAPISYGWCHGPTGTVRLFDLLDREQPARGWGEHARACRDAVRASGLPARLYPGFWDNLGQCCGTAGVGEMALDQYQRTGDPQWLAWAQTLAADVLERAISDDHGVRWSHTEHRASPPDLEPQVGRMQGAAGIASWLLRLWRVQRDGPDAATLWWPDRPAVAHRLAGG